MKISYNFVMSMKEHIEEAFVKVFGNREDFISVTTPGRANLIGEHVDYQGGHVLPMAVNRFIYCTGRKRTDNKIKLFSFNYNESFEADTQNISFQSAARWPNYILGVVQEFKKLGHSMPGMEIVFGGDVPVGSGLSSSAAVEICTAVFMEKMYDIKIEPVELIKLARRAENEFVGVQCGIMDQFAVHLSKKKSALLLDCGSLEYRHVPLQTGSAGFLLVDTKKERSLSSSVYNERVRSVTESLSVIKKHESVEFLTQVEDMAAYRNILSGENFKRALHIWEENRRVLSAVKSLEDGMTDDCGKAMYESHASLKDLYEVSCDELDFIVNFSKESDGVKGARLTGAGMGGCAIVLLEKNKIPDYSEKLSAFYANRFGRKPAFYDVEPVNGAHFENNP